jgi:ATP-dependent Clp protease ATP-binding subunit ClpB
MFNNYNIDSLRVIKEAKKIAGEQNFCYTHSGHLLLAIMRSRVSIASEILCKMYSIQEAEIKTEVIDILTHNTSSSIKMSSNYRVYSPRVLRIIANARTEAHGLKQNFISINHLLLALLLEDTGSGIMALSRSSVSDLGNIRITLLHKMEEFSNTSFPVKIPLYRIPINFNEFIFDKEFYIKSTKYEDYFPYAARTYDEYEFREIEKQKILDAKNLLLNKEKPKKSKLWRYIVSWWKCIVSWWKCIVFWVKYLWKKIRGISPKRVKTREEKAYNEALKKYPTAAPYKYNKAQVIKDYTTDFTVDAVLGRQSELFMGRRIEMRKIIVSLARKKKNSVILLGLPGVGKNSIVKALVKEIITGNAPELLHKKVVLCLDTYKLANSLDPKVELSNFVKAVIADKNFIIFIDEIHSFIFAKTKEGPHTKESALDAANILKPILGREGFQCLGTTTVDNYEKSIKSDPALDRRFRTINIPEMDLIQALNIIIEKHQDFENFHQVQITKQALFAAVDLSILGIQEGQLPGKAEDVIDACCSQVKLLNRKVPPIIEECEIKLWYLYKQKQKYLKLKKYDKVLETIKSIMKYQNDFKKLFSSFIIFLINNDESTTAHYISLRYGLLLCAFDNTYDFLYYKHQIEFNKSSFKEKFNDKIYSKFIFNENLHENFYSKIIKKLRSKSNKKKVIFKKPISIPTKEKPLSEKQFVSKLFKYIENNQEINKMKSKEKGLTVDNGKPIVYASDIQYTISTWGNRIAYSSGVGADDLALADMELSKGIIGQEHVIEAITRVLQVAQFRDSTNKKPIASFLFSGPTGVGKTEVAKVLADFYFKGQDKMIRFDMSEFNLTHNVTKFIGAAPGMEGYGKGGLLTNAVKNQPHSLILFDEIEKAHFEIFNSLLQVLDDGRLTDSTGQIVDFKDTLIVMTSNIGGAEVQAPDSEFQKYFTEQKLQREKDILEARYHRNSRPIPELLEYEEKERYISNRVHARLEESFRPELLNRIDQIIIFNKLSKTDIIEIAVKSIKTLNRRLHEQKLNVSVTQPAIRALAKEGYQPIFGARPLRRAITRNIEDSLSLYILKRGIKKNTLLSVDYKNGAYIVFDSCSQDENMEMNSNVKVDDKEEVSEYYMLDLWRNRNKIKNINSPFIFFNSIKDE